jgi:outer membrane lipoprotein SlyB
MCLYLAQSSTDNLFIRRALRNQQEENMETIKSTSRIHPLMAAAAVAVILVSAVGVAAITGILPTSHGSSAPVASVTAPATPVTPPANDTKDTKVSANEAPSHTPAAPVSQHHPARPAQHPAPVVAAQSICENCGRIESVQAIQEPAKPSGLGVVAGAVLGGALGNQVGNGNGRTLATVAGAVGGGYAGNEVEKRTRSTTTYEVRVRMEDGSIRTFPSASQPGWGVGDHVKVVNGALTSRG